MTTALALLLVAASLKGENPGDPSFTLAWTAMQACASSGAQFERAAARLAADGWSRNDHGQWVKADKGPQVVVELSHVRAEGTPETEMCTVSSPAVSVGKALKAFSNLVGRPNFKADRLDRSANWRINVNASTYFASVRGSLSGAAGATIALLSIPKVEPVK